MCLCPRPAGHAIAIYFATSGHPTFNVNHVRVFWAKVSRAALKETIRQFERLQQLLHDADHLLVPPAAFRFVRFANYDLLNFVELMDAEQTGSITAGCTRFTSEA